MGKILCMALRTRAMEQGMEDRDTVLRGDTAALGTDTTVPIGTGIGRGTGKGRGVQERGSITGRGAEAEVGMRSTEGRKKGSIMMRDIEKETERELGILKGKGNEREKENQERRKPG